MEQKSNKSVVCITINTDASWHPELKVGGYAFYIICDLFKIQKGGKFKKNPLHAEEAEIMCIGNAIATLLAQKELPNAKVLVINNDCKFGMHKIQKKQGVTAKAVHKLWIKLAARIGSEKNLFKYVKAHNGTPDARSWVNDWCDKEAKKWMRIAANEQRKNNQTQS
jgi:hypothetical protein